MGQGISQVVPFAVGVAIVPIPIIAVILMLFSQRARVNGPLFLLGWVAGLTVAFGVVYALSDAGDVATDSTASDTVSWGTLVLGALLLLMAVRSWQKRPAPGVTPPMPKWMAGMDAIAPGKALGLGIVLSAANPKNLILVIGAAAGLAQLGLTTGDAVVALIVFVVIGSLSVLGPVAYSLRRRRGGGADAGRAEGLARGEQRCRDGGALPGLRRRAGLERPGAAHGLTLSTACPRRAHPVGMMWRLRMPSYDGGSCRAFTE